MPLQIADRQIQQEGAGVGDVLTWNGTKWAPAVPGAASIPTGAIIMWSGLLSAIPAGWKLCDGTLGTPDLRDKFVRGAAAGADPGATGGAATHTHAGHSNHVVTQPANHSDHSTAGAHTHDAHTTTTVTVGITTVLDGPITHSSVGGHTHDTHSAHTGAAVDAHSAHDSVSLLPTFFALAFLMKS